jgi:hypothetical protein
MTGPAQGTLSSITGTPAHNQTGLLAPKLPTQVSFFYDLDGRGSGRQKIALTLWDQEKILGSARERVIEAVIPPPQDSL